MTIADFDWILEVAATQNLGRAAANLDISQPTLSYRIRRAEEELGFALFTRTAKGMCLTPAGAQFCGSLGRIRTLYQNAVEQAQNVGSGYEDRITVGMPARSALPELPGVMAAFAARWPHIWIEPVYAADDSADLFVRLEADIMFAQRHIVQGLPGTDLHPLFESGIYLITLADDPLAEKECVHAEDLRGRTLMTGGGSPPALRAVEQRVTADMNLPSFRSTDHETMLTNVAAGRGVCLAPGFLNDGHPQFAWTRFDCPETVPCVLCTHKNDGREAVRDLTESLVERCRSRKNP